MVQEGPGGLGGSRGSREGAAEEGVQKLCKATKHEKLDKFRSYMSSLLRSCIQDCVQEVPVREMAQGTPPQRTPRPSQVATGFINFSMAFLPSLK